MQERRALAEWLSRQGLCVRRSVRARCASGPRRRVPRWPEVWVDPVVPMSRGLFSFSALQGRRLLGIVLVAMRLDQLLRQGHDRHERPDPYGVVEPPAEWTRR